MVYNDIYMYILYNYKTSRKYNNYKYALNMGPPQNTEQILTDLNEKQTIKINSKGLQYPKINNDRSSRQKIKKETLNLNHTLDKMELTGINKTLYRTAGEIYIIL